ncbi:sensor histidine kinase [Streptomyces sp. NPDC014892]|uniref:sensor histidine kinase n=1 Tax=Streptomyces sp. NPDC014892 TaxID=3364930 RepID=UPI0036FFFBD2
MWEWGTDGPAAALGVVAAVAVCLAAGLAVALVRTRRRWQKAVGERGWMLERERESAARAAIAAERDRIARELHDIVSHNVSLMVVQAGAAREVLGTMPDEAAAALLAVEDAGRGAMTDLRHLLGLLAPSQNGEDEADVQEGLDATAASDARKGAGRDAEVDGDVVGAGVERVEWPELAELTPQPGLDRLGTLVDRISFAGLPVEVRISGEPRPLPQGIDVTAYRIVQEALTNALRHGDGGKAEVTVRYADRALRVEVLNTGPSVLTGGAPSSSHPSPSHPSPSHSARPTPRHPYGTGRGLLGLRERVAVYGGDLDARRRLGGGYRVRARIPLDRP